MTNKLEHGVDVNVPVTVAYNQWTQFEEFPRFMRHVESVLQLDANHLRWHVNLGGKVRVFDAEIVEQIPDKRIAWRSTADAHHSGVVTFHRLTDRKCRVMLQLDYEPEGLLEKLGTLVGVPEWNIAEDMTRFAEFVEKRQVATGAWRGQILNKDDAAEGAAGSPAGEERPPEQSASNS